MPTRLSDLPVRPLDLDLLGLHDGLVQFARRPAIAALDWPLDIVEQWLFDHGDNPNFLHDYRQLDLENLHWNSELVPLSQLRDIPTGASDRKWLSQVADQHAYWLSIRPVAVRDAWDKTGTWLTPPLLIDRRLLSESHTGLQVIEGRTRLGILQGRARDGSRVAGHHEAWVGRPRR